MAGLKRLLFIFVIVHYFFGEKNCLSLFIKLFTSHVWRARMCYILWQTASGYWLHCIDYIVLVLIDVELAVGKCVILDIFSTISSFPSIQKECPALMSQALLVIFNLSPEVIKWDMQARKTSTCPLSSVGTRRLGSMLTWAERMCWWWGDSGHKQMVYID